MFTFAKRGIQCNIAHRTQHNESAYRKEQLANRINIVKMLTLFTFKFAKRRIRPSNAYHDISNINHFGSVPGSLGRLAATSECMATVRKREACQKNGTCTGHVDTSARAAELDIPQHDRDYLHQGSARAFSCSL